MSIKSSFNRARKIEHNELAIERGDQSESSGVPPGRWSWGWGVKPAPRVVLRVGHELE